MNDHESTPSLRSKEITQTNNVARIEKLLQHITSGDGAMFCSLGLAALRGVDGVNVARNVQERAQAMQHNRKILASLYARYQVDESLTTMHVRTTSSYSLHLHVERFSPLGIGFIEDASYSARENPGLAVTYRPHVGVGLGYGYPPTSDEHNPTVPQSFDAAAHAVVNGKMPYQYLD